MPPNSVGGHGHFIDQFLSVRLPRKRFAAAFAEAQQTSSANLLDEAGSFTPARFGRRVIGDPPVDALTAGLAFADTALTEDEPCASRR